ncbi:hypothetical protein [Flavobacterium fluviatile]|uniref:hypothetical protein n=1 Tax=Flavobacterium fluviatile TaxID=1862387 RepID=UPI0013D4F991|nr:hypothetical protein [Flavobacterium fluviatile]
MRKKITLLIMSCLFYMNGYSQTPFWSDSFEDTGSPTSGTRSAPSAFAVNNNGSRVFNIASNADLSIVGDAAQGVTYSYIGADGTKFWAGEDTDNGVTPVTIANVLKTVTWTIDISGKSNIKLKGLFAAGNTTNTPGAYENTSTSATIDYMSMQYSINGGPIQDLLNFYPLANVSSRLYPDADFDKNGDPAATPLSNTFTEFIGNINGTGTTLTLYMNMAMSGSAEEVAVDNLRLVEIASCVSPTAYNVTGTNSYCAGGSGVAVGLSNSETGVTYQLKNGTTDIGTPVAGTGSSISFGNQITAATYTVVATRTVGGCTNNMNGSAIVTITSPPAVPTVSTTPATCSANGTASIANYSAYFGCFGFGYNSTAIGCTGCTDCIDNCGYMLG